MSTLADVIRKKRSTGQSRTSSLLGSLKDKFKESIDPRQLINQSGLLTALFPSLKSYKAQGISSDVISTLSKTITQQTVSSPSLLKIQKNTEISAKNSLVLSSISRDVNILKQNVIKLVKISGVKPATKADMFFLKQSENEKMYESLLGKRDQSSKVERVEIKKKGFNFIKFITMMGSGIVSLLMFDFLFRKKDSVVYKLYEGITNKIQEWKTDVQLFISGLFEDFNAFIESTLEKTGKIMDDTFDKISEMISLNGILDLIKSGETPTERLDKILEGAKQKASETLNQFSMIPEAKAATIPSTFKGLDSVDANLANRGIKGSAEEAMNFFMSRGWTKEQSAGIVGNLIQESRNLDPTAWNPNENAQGLAQWTPVGNRQQMIAERLGKPILQASFREQLEVIDWELKNKETKASASLRKAKTASEAAIIIDAEYERSRGTERHERIRYANQLMNIPTTGKTEESTITKTAPAFQTPEQVIGRILEQESASQVSQENLPQQIVDTLVYYKSDSSVAVMQKTTFSGNKIDPVDRMISIVA